MLPGDFSCQLHHHFQTLQEASYFWRFLLSVKVPLSYALIPDDLSSLDRDHNYFTTCPVAHMRSQIFHMAVSQVYFSDQCDGAILRLEISGKN